jgi:hypothetical protein
MSATNSTQDTKSKVWAYHNGAVMRGAAINDILDRLDKASRVARRLSTPTERESDDANVRALRASMLKVARMVKGIYNTIDREYGKSQYVHDVRVKLGD